MGSISLYNPLVISVVIPLAAGPILVISYY